MACTSSKRKAEQPQHPELSFQKKRRIEAQDARLISAQTSGKAFANGEVDVDAFTKARQFEIRSLQDAIRRSKKTLSARAFQSVPRDLRRRTASHNLSRVPKRLKSRALKEMLQDNTPAHKSKHKGRDTRMRLRRDATKTTSAKPRNFATKANKTSEEMERVPNPSLDRQLAKSGFRESRLKKNRLLKPSLPQAKFRKRQIHKTWLPTHLYHAKRAHMTPPNEPLWRMAIPLSPTAKSYRPTHRASTSRGAVAWDVSYISTIALEGAESAILETLKKFEVGGTNFKGRDLRRWTAGSRFWQGWLYKPESNMTESIAPVEIGWIAKPEPEQAEATDGGVALPTAKPESSKSKTTLRRKAFIRVHPSAFLQLWEMLLTECKAQKPPVLIQDLRFEIGSIHLVGPASSEALMGILQKATSTSTDSRIAGASNVSAALLSSLSAINDPAMLPANSLIGMDVMDPRLRPRNKHRDRITDPSASLQTLSEWPLDKSPANTNLFDTACRNRACRQMPSQKSVNRRKTVATPNSDPEPLPTDPQIPVLLMASRGGLTGRSGWTALLPWRCVRVFWYSLMYYPLSTGGTISFAGLNEQRQIAFEAGVPWFPADFPGTEAGLSWEQLQREKRKAEWEKRPKGKRIEWDTLNLGQGRRGEIGTGWSCDWSALQRIECQNIDKGKQDEPLRRIPYSSALTRLREPHAVRESGEKLGVVEVKLEMLSQGVPKTCSRIYRLPTDNPESRSRWMSLRFGVKRQSNPKALVKRSKQDMPPHILQQQLAASLLEPEAQVRPGHEEYPCVPGEQDLIGFVTTGDFNLGQGKGVGIGSILLHKVLAETDDSTRATAKSKSSAESDGYLCIVREAGHSIGRLAKWKLASTQS